MALALSAMLLCGVAAQASTPLDTLWADLADEDAGRAYRAIWALVSTPKESMKLFKEQVHPAVAPDQKRLENLISDLDSGQFAVRTKALREFEKLGDLAEPTLRDALKRSKLSLETRVRVEQLLKSLHGPVKSSQTLRALRAVEAMEHMGTAEARELLAELARGATGARLTVEAREALARLR